MALRFITELTEDQHRARIYKDTDWGEYRVRYFAHTDTGPVFHPMDSHKHLL